VDKRRLYGECMANERPSCPTVALDACGRAEKYKDCVEWKLQLSLRLVKGGDADNMSTKPGVTFVAA
jgi:hypothetical protein